VRRSGVGVSHPLGTVASEEVQVTASEAYISMFWLVAGGCLVYLAWFIVRAVRERDTGKRSRTARQ